MPVEMVTRKMRNDGDERGLIVYGYKLTYISKFTGNRRKLRVASACFCVKGQGVTEKYGVL
jgi:hypothetical protein